MHGNQVKALAIIPSYLAGCPWNKSFDRFIVNIIQLHGARTITLSYKTRPVHTIHLIATQFNTEWKESR